MKVTKAKRKPKWTGQDFKRARRAAESLYYYRMNRMGEEGKLFQDYRGPIPPANIEAAEYQLYHTPVFWHCVAISYFEDPWGKKYRRWGFAKTERHLKLADKVLDPLLMVARQAAEDGANEKQVVARSFILAPWNKQHSDLYPLVKKHAKELELTEEDLEGIKDYLNDPYELFEYDPEEYIVSEDTSDLDTQIAKYL